SSAFCLKHCAITESRCRRAFESSFCECHVWLSCVKQLRLSEGPLSGFDIGKQFFVSHQVPDFLASALFDGDHAQQSKAAFKLKNQIVTGSEGLVHCFEKVSASWLEAQTLQDARLPNQLKISSRELRMPTLGSIRREK